MAIDVVLTDPWIDLRRSGIDEGVERDRWLTEIRNEVSDGHPLSGTQFEVVGRSTARDDVLLRLASGTWAIVHISWKKPERPPWPLTRFYELASDVEEAIDMAS